MKPSILLLTVTVALAGCADTSASLDSGRMGPIGSRSVTQGGAQDIGYFRSIVESGGVPRPSTIEAVGFFAEHAIDLPDADCGEAVCLHANLAVAPGIDQESNWTMAFVAMNTAVDPRALARPDTHVVVAVEDTVRTEGFARSAGPVLRALANELLPGDRISVIRIGAHAEVVAQGLAPADPALAAVPAAFTATEATSALYDGLARASLVIEDVSETFEGAHRVVLVTSGIADAGVTDDMRILGLGDALASEGVGVSVVGLGDDFRPELATQISEGGGGTYSYAQRVEDLVEVFTLEGRTSLFPLATDFELVVEPAPGYRVGRVYGARRAWAEQSAAYLSSPVLMIGNRSDATDVDEGRRGGGGGLFVELIVDPELAASIGPGAPAFSLLARYVDPQTGATVTQTQEVSNALAPGANPSGMFPHFADPLRGKAFMMLNMYLSLRTTVELYHEGSCGEALGIVPAMEGTYDGWQGEYEDPDIGADWALLTTLSENVRGLCTGVAPVAPVAPMSCFYD
ncbi:MAG: hypothetical protein H6719_22050 [Sandaracinaceae bacterium]|nr:hypothetical protein [Sandaracinaceae bacterium]